MALHCNCSPWTVSNDDVVWVDFVFFIQTSGWTALLGMGMNWPKKQNLFWTWANSGPRSNTGQSMHSMDTPQNSHMVWEVWGNSGTRNSGKLSINRNNLSVAVEFFPETSWCPPKLDKHCWLTIKELSFSSIGSENYIRSDTTLGSFLGSLQQVEEHR